MLLISLFLLNLSWQEVFQRKDTHQLGTLDQLEFRLAMQETGKQTLK